MLVAREVRKTKAPSLLLYLCKDLHIYFNSDEKNEGFFKDLPVAEGGFPLFQVPGLSSKGPHPAGTGMA